MLYVVGHLAINQHYVVDRIPSADQDAMLLSHSAFPGGAAGNVATAVAHLGGEVSLVSRVGDDAYGYMLRDEIIAQGVGADHISVDPNRPTTEMVAIKTTDGRRSFLIDLNGASNDAETVVRIASAGSQEEWAFVGCPLLLAAQIAAKLRPSSVSVALGFWIASDEINLIGQLDPVLRKARFAFLNASEYASISPPVSEAIEGAIQRGLTVITTDAEHPIRVHHAFGIEYFEVPPLAGLVDTIGCGDAFMGSFLAAWETGADLTGCVNRGISAARRVAMIPTERFPHPSRSLPDLDRR